MIIKKTLLLSTAAIVLLLNLCFVTFGFQYIYLGISYCIVGVIFVISLLSSVFDRDNIFTTILLGVFIVVNLLSYLLIKGWIWLDNSNSSLTPMMRIAITGGVVAVLSKLGKETYKQMWNWCHQYLITMCTIVNTDENGVFKYVMKYLITHGNCLEIQRARIGDIQTKMKKNFWTHSIQKYSNICWTPDEGFHLFYYNWEGKRVKIFLDITTEVMPFNAGMDRRPFEKIRIRLWVFGRGRRDILKSLCETAKREYYSVPEGYISIMTPDRWANNWEEDKLIEYPNIDKTYFEKKHIILEKCSRFIRGEEYYNVMGRDYRLGLLFHGPPGNGKTKMSTNIAAYLKFSHICVLHLQHTGIDSSNLQKLLRDTPENAIILIEDIDRKNIKIDRSLLLNTIDGLSAYEKRIFILTTNDIDCIDEAIRRRCDLEIHFPYATSKAIRKILQDNYPHITKTTLDNFINLTDEYNLRMSDIESFVLYQRINSRIPDNICSNIDSLLDRGVKK